VQVITWKYRWTISEVEHVLEDHVIVKWVNVVKKAVKKQWFVEKTLPIHTSNVMFYCEKCKKAVRLTVEVNAKWQKVRVCKKCKAEYK